MKKQKAQEAAYKVENTKDLSIQEEILASNKSPVYEKKRESAYQVQQSLQQKEQNSSEDRKSSQKMNGQNVKGASFASKKQSPRNRHVNMKPSSAPTQSLMSIDFSMRQMNNVSGNRRNNAGFTSQTSGDSLRVNQPRDKNSSLIEQVACEPLLPSLHNDNQRPWMRPNPAPLIVDLGLASQSQQQSSQVKHQHWQQQPKSLLGGYWENRLSPGQPASLLEFMPSDGLLGRPNFQLNQGRPISNPHRQSEPNLLKRPAPSTFANNFSGPKHLRKEQKQMKKTPFGASDRLLSSTGNGHEFVLIPASCSTVYLQGRARITVLRGEATILSNKLKEGASYDVFSPTSGSLLSLQCLKAEKFAAAEVKKELSKFNVAENTKDLEGLADNIVCILKMDVLESSMCDYVTSFSPYTQLFTVPQAREKNANFVRGVVMPKLGIKVAPMKDMIPLCLTGAPQYDEVLNKFTKHLTESADKPVPVWLCCGAKNTGKSTFCRMLINTALQSVDAVGFLDCDVGQTEFSPPATISFHIITKPILGQPFCHQRKAERMAFYGEVAAGLNPTLYMKCLTYVLEAYTEMQDKPPLIVNTMGFPEGIGLMLMVDTLQFVRPTVVVQIESNNQATNFPAITQEFVALEEGWTTNKEQVTDPKGKVEATPAHELILLSTLLNQRRDFSLKFKPQDLRNLSLLSSLIIDLEPGLTLTSVPPLVIEFKQLAIHVCHHSLSAEESLTAIDVSVVALCAADLSKAYRVNEQMPLIFDETPVCDCLGFGVVRAVDVERGLLYLTTSLPRASLTKVNTLLKGCLSVPDQIILKQKPQGSDALPYVDALAPSTGVSAVRPRARMPRGGNGNM